LANVRIFIVEKLLGGSLSPMSRTLASLRHSIPRKNEGQHQKKLILAAQTLGN